jgi:fluoroquinolone transport system ATP-binding protein
MKTRLSLARAILHDPALLFLDEPTEGLDPALAAKVRRIIREERDRGKTVFLTTHDMITAEKLCDRVGFLLEGRLRLIDEPRKLALRYGRAEARVEYREGDTLGVADFPLESLAMNESFLDILKHPGLETIHTREAGLGDIFLRLTGKALE